MMSKLHEALLEEISRIPVVDTHEHLPAFETERDQNTDFLREYLTHYMSSDLRSSGLSEKAMRHILDGNVPLEERWLVVEPHWEKCRYTGYGRALDVSARAIHKVDGIRRETVRHLQDSFKESLRPGHFKKVLKEMCGIEVCLLNAFTAGFECDREFFRRVWPADNYMIPDKPQAGKIVLALESEYGLKVKSLDDWMHAFEVELEAHLSHGIVAIKSFIAYQRSLRFEKVAYRAASVGFARAIREWEKEGRGENDAFTLPRDVQDFMMHYILKIAGRRGVPLQLHTGLLEGTGNFLSNSDPGLLENLFLAYPGVKFDLFHIGYPFHAKTAALAKMFPNVFVDMCWAHIISPWTARQALHDFLDAVPYNKISAFGGDYGFVDGVYGHLLIARENVSRVLSEKVEDGVFGLDKALDIARALFHDNPVSIFDLKRSP